MKDCKFCHCERSEAICVIGEKLFESDVQKGFRVSFINLTDCFATLAMTALVIYLSKNSNNNLTPKAVPALCGANSVSPKAVPAISR